MIIRPTLQSDLDDVLALWKKYQDNTDDQFRIPNFKNTVTHAVVESDNKIVAFGMVKLFAEAILVLDYDASKRTKIGAIQKLMLEAIRGCNQHDLSQLHSFIQNKDFAQLMMKHYSFERCKGETLVMTL